jgi:hypothetical protein
LMERINYEMEKFDTPKNDNTISSEKKRELKKKIRDFRGKLACKLCQRKSCRKCEKFIEKNTEAYREFKLSKSILNQVSRARKIGDMPCIFEEIEEDIKNCNFGIERIYYNQLTNGLMLVYSTTGVKKMLREQNRLSDQVSNNLKRGDCKYFEYSSDFIRRNKIIHQVADCRHTFRNWNEKNEKTIDKRGVWFLLGNKFDFYLGYKFKRLDEDKEKNMEIFVDIDDTSQKKKKFINLSTIPFPYVEDSEDEANEIKFVENTGMLKLD